MSLLDAVGVYVRDLGSFSEMTIEIGSIRSVLEEEIRIRTKFDNRRVLVQLDWIGLDWIGLD